MCSEAVQWLITFRKEISTEDFAQQIYLCDAVCTYSRRLFDNIVVEFHIKALNQMFDI